jgi:hypothetical protein
LTLYATAQLQKQTTHPRLICRGQTDTTQTFLRIFLKIFRDSSHSLYREIELQHLM